MSEVWRKRLTSTALKYQVKLGNLIYVQAVRQNRGNAAHIGNAANPGLSSSGADITKPAIVFAWLG